MDAILDGAESLLVEIGYAAITTRKLAERAGVNHWLIHYYFGSMEEVFLQVLERYTKQLTERQRTMYSGDEPFVEKWRTAMRYLVADDERSYQKIWLELQAMAWSQTELRLRVGRVLDQWKTVLVPAFRDGLRELGVNTRLYPVDAIVALVVTFNEGVILERLMGVDSGHEQLLQMIDRMLVRMERDTRSR